MARTVCFRITEEKIKMLGDAVPENIKSLHTLLAFLMVNFKFTQCSVFKYTSSLRDFASFEPSFTLDLVKSL